MMLDEMRSSHGAATQETMVAGFLDAFGKHLDDASDFWMGPRIYDE